VQSLKAAGASPTQASVTDVLKNTHTFDSNGLVAPADPGANKPPTCWLMIKAVGTTWQRVTPDTGYRCDPGGYFYYQK
jgi:hypothetical protein